MPHIGRKILPVLALLLMAVPASAQSVDEIISNYNNARGGLDKLKAVRTERITGTLSFGPDADGSFVLQRKRPLKLHMEITLNGQTFIRVYDGKSAGWIYNPFTPNPSVAPMSETELNSIVEDADFDGPFVDYKDKGNKIEYAGKGEIQGSPAYKLKLTSKSGDVSYFYFDVSSGLLLKWEGNRKINDKDVPWETYYHDFRDVNGLKYPFLVEADAPGTDQTQRISWEKVEVNPPLEDALFEKPNPPAAPASTSAPKPN